LSLRVAGPSHAKSIVDFVNQALRSRYFHGEYSLDSDKFVSMAKKGRFLLVESGDHIAGCVYVEPRPTSSLLELLVVRPEMRRSGIGSQLVEAAESLCRSMKSNLVHVQVANLNYEIVRFCRRRGYTEFDRVPCQCDSKSSLHCYTLKMVKHLDRRSLGF
jgi:N-acetylglutamate synthase-like GNAT family acetyltransferase